MVTQPLQAPANTAEEPVHRGCLQKGLRDGKPMSAKAQAFTLQFTNSELENFLTKVATFCYFLLICFYERTKCEWDNYKQCDIGSKKYNSEQNLYLIKFFFLFQACIDLNSWVKPCTVSYNVTEISSCDDDIYELQHIFFYQVK